MGLRFAKRKLALHGAVLALGLLSAFHPTLLSGFASLQADPGDTLLNGYILEHSWQWLTRPDYVGSYWSPAFFHPQKLVLAYSENLLGTAPLYWLLRLAVPALTAYQLWMMLITALTYVSFAAVLRRLGVGHLLAAVGGFVFAFGSPRLIHIGHQQLLPHLFAPWAVLAGWTFLNRPTVAIFAGLLAASYAQLLAGIYLGWFTLFGLAVFAAVTLIADRELWQPLVEFGRRRWPAVLALVAVWAGLVVLLLAPYGEANRGFHRPYDEVRALTPVPTDWLSPTALSVWHGWLPKSGVGELWLFVGFVPLVIAWCGFGGPPGQVRLRTACLVTALVLVVLATRYGGLWTWKPIYRWVPGGQAIRAVGRIVFTVELFALMGGLVGLGNLLRRARFGDAIAGLILAVAIWEQLPVRSPQSFAIAPWQERVNRVREQMVPGTPSYVDLPPGRPYWESQLIAMWAGLEANVPVVNGYSGRYPAGYPDWTRSMTDDELRVWTGDAPAVRIKQ
jgi:hypothetical protein